MLTDEQRRLWRSVCEKCMSARTVVLNRDERSAVIQVRRHLTDRTEVADKYATAARVISLHLREFFDEALPYDEAIAETARKAQKEIVRLRAVLADKEPDDNWLADIEEAENGRSL